LKSVVHKNFVKNNFAIKNLFSKDFY
jgi:hypothetical protein